MILTYSVKESFVGDILNGVKIHSIREDKTNRWHPGRSIQHWWGNPRNVQKKPYCFLENKCLLVQRIDIYPMPDFDNPLLDAVEKIGIAVDYSVLPTEHIEKLIINDGLTPDEFLKFFLADEYSFEGKIIHWTDFRY